MPDFPDRNPDPWLPGSPSDPAPRVRFAPTVRVYRYTPPSDYDLLDNVECVFIEQHTGPDPGVAGFRYVFGTGDIDAPQSIEEALSTNVLLPKVIAENDRLVVHAAKPDGSIAILFDGLALDFGMAIAGNSERVDIHAIGIARKLKDQVIGGGLWRYANDPTNPDANFATDIVAQFNPKGKANASPADADVASGGPSNYLHPAFLDPTIPGLNQRKWTLAMAAKYLIYHHNADEEFVLSPTDSDLDDLLQARIPIDGTDFVITDPGTYTLKPIIVSDKPLTGRDWPSVLHEFLRPSAFDLCYMLQADGDHNPQTRLRLWERRTPDPKDLWLQPRGSNLEPRLTNVGSAQIKRNLTNVITDWQVDGALKRYEDSFILAPGFPMHATDGVSVSNLENYSKSNPNWPSSNHDAYRLYIFDETGEGHYDMGDTTELTDVTSLEDLLGTDSYVGRRRKPLGDLLTLDPDGKPIKWRLSYTTTYAGPKPGLWDGTGTWTPILHGAELLKDRIGIYVNVTNPNHWVAGKDSTTGADITLKGVENQCDSAAPNFFLRLTCCIDGDQNLQGNAYSSGYSPLPLSSAITRRIDARDRYRLDTIGPYSEFNNTADPVIKRDDSEAAEAEAAMNRATTESGILEGAVTIPYLTDYYQLGDPIRQINGRNLGFRTDGGTDSSAVYPLVEGRRWNLVDRHQTVLYLSDESQARHGLERKIRR